MTRARTSPQVVANPWQLDKGTINDNTLTYLLRRDPAGPPAPLSSPTSLGGVLLDTWEFTELRALVGAGGIGTYLTFLRETVPVIAPPGSSPLPAVPLLSPDRWVLRRGQFGPPLLSLTPAEKTAFQAFIQNMPSPIPGSNEWDSRGIYTDWVETHRNLILAPRMLTTDLWTYAAGGGGTGDIRVAIGDEYPGWNRYIRATVGTSGTWFRLRAERCRVPVAEVPYVASAWLRGAPVSTSGAVIITWYDSSGVNLGQISSIPREVVGSTFRRIELSGVAPAGTMSAIIEWGLSSGAAGDFIDVGGPQFEPGVTASDFLQGQMSPTDGMLQKIFWDGPMDASESVMQERKALGR